MAKTIQIETETFTGAEIYRLLGTYRVQRDDADGAIWREREKRDFFEGQVSRIRVQMYYIDEVIARRKYEIIRLEVLQAIQEINIEEDVPGVLRWLELMLGSPSITDDDLI